LPAVRAFRAQKPALHGEALRVLEEMNTNGIAITTADKLLEQPGLFAELSATVQQYEQERAAAITEARQNAEEAGQKKSFIYELLDRKPALDPTSIWVRFALQKPLLEIANSYFGMLTHLRFFNVWHTFTTTSAPKRSQLWHRDPEDHLILKVFVYLTDVDAGAGPLTYVPTTHPKGKRSGVSAESFKEQGHGALRSEDEQMSKVLPADQWVTGVGEAGTIIFGDTRGYHKGGLARTHDRIMYNCMYVSPASKAAELFTRQPNTSLVELDGTRIFALNTP